MNIASVSRFTTSLLLAGFGFAMAHAQVSRVRVDVKADLATKPEQGYGTAKMAYGDEGSVVALRTKNGQNVLGGVSQADLDWSLRVLNRSDMTEIKHDQPKFVWGIGPVAMETIETFNKKFRIILTKPDATNGKLLVLEQVLSPRSLTGRAAALVAEIPYDRLGKSPEYFAPGMALGLTTTVAADGRHMLIGLTPASTVRSAGCPIFAMVVDGKMQPKWSNVLATDAAAVRVDIEGVKVAKDGAVWYLVKNTMDAAPKTKDVLGYNFTVYRMDSVGQRSATITMNKGDLAQDVSFDLLDDGTIVCAGIYSSPDTRRNESVGIFTTKLDPAKMEWSPFVRTAFEKQLVNKVERLQTNMHMENLWPRNDGGLFVVTERSGIETHMVSDLSGKKMEKTEWVNGAFHVMELKPDGEMKWYTSIPREMSFANDGPGKAFSIRYQDMLYLFFNDVASNMDLRRSKEPITPVDKPRDALMLEFKDGGGYKEKVVLSDRYGQGYFDADVLWPMGEGLYGLEGAPDFRKDRSFPIILELSGTAR